MDHSSQPNTLQYEKGKGTGQWFLDTSEFQKWTSGVSQELFCPGMPGAGKTFIASLVINHIQTKFPSRSEVGLTYIYCNYRDHATQTLPALISSLIKQLAQSHQLFSSMLQTMYDSHKPNFTRPSVDELDRVLHEVAGTYERCFLIIDGVDECQEHGGIRKKLLEIVCQLPDFTSSNVLVTSRYVQSIEFFFGKSDVCL